MTINQAKRYLSTDISDLPLNQLQQLHVHLLDAWRESRAEYGIPQALRDGFYISVPELRTAVPRDTWLSHNLSVRLDEIEAVLRRCQ